LVPQEACADSDTKAGINAGSAPETPKPRQTPGTSLGYVFADAYLRESEKSGTFYLWEYVEFCLEKGEQKEMLLLTDLLFS
jgi:hypothetical protein